MKDISFIDNSANEEYKEQLGSITNHLSQKPKIIKHNREAIFLRKFILSLMKQYKYNGEIKPKKEIIKPKVLEKTKIQNIKPKAPLSLPTQELIPEVPDFLHHEEENKMPKAPENSIIPKAPKFENKETIPKFNSEDIPKFNN